MKPSGKRFEKKGLRRVRVGLTSEIRCPRTSLKDRLRVGRSGSALYSSLNANRFLSPGKWVIVPIGLLCKRISRTARSPIFFWLQTIGRNLLLCSHSALQSLYSVDQCTRH